MISVFGQTTNGLPILAHHFGHGDRKVLILGGVHGDETEGVQLAHALIERCLAMSDWRIKLTVVPAFNLDGVLAKTRGNARGVDLNRNLPTKDWSAVATTARYQPGPHPLSESENQALAHAIDTPTAKPDFIFSLHSWKPLLNINDPAGSTLCRDVAERIAAWTKDPIEPTIGYSTPGCLGTYAGFERGIPTLTYEIERGLSCQNVIRKNLVPLLEGMKHLEQQLCESAGRAGAVKK